MRDSVGRCADKFSERAFGAFEREKEKKDQGTTSRTQRKPMTLYL